MKARIPIMCALVALACAAIGPFAAESASSSPKQASSTPQPAALTGKASQSPDEKKAGEGSLPDAYRGISLGMEMDAVKEALAQDGIFGYRGERDVSLLPTMNRSLIESSGQSFIRRSWFQFHDGKLYVMTFNLDPERVDYYSMYSTLVQKYGEPASLDPRKATWDDGKTTLSLERPLTVRYVDAETFKALLDAAGTEKAASDLLREGFLGDF